MPSKVTVSTLNASTIDILNTIRANASYEYQSSIPEITSAHDIPAVGEILYGYPALANQFMNALINRIALVNVKSAVFNNAYAELKKGYLQFGETVEEVFINIAKAREFSAEDAHARELKRSLPDVKTAFHAVNWKVQYPVTIQDEELRQAFLSIDGVQDLIAKVVNSVYTAAEYDEYLLFKYLMIKAITAGKMYPAPIDMDDVKNAATAFRGYSNKIQFVSDDYNSARVHTATPKADQYIFMDANFNAQFDVEVLASAFNMDKAEFMGKLVLVDDWTTFDNDRFSAIRDGSDMIEEVTSAELTLMGKVKAVLVDKEWFQVYDNNIKFTENYVASGMYWNYYLNTWKTVSSSPFSNAIVFVDDSATTTLPNTLTAKVVDKSVNASATVITLAIADADSLVPANYIYVQTEDAVEEGIAVHKYGAYIFPADDDTNLQIDVLLKDKHYLSTSGSGLTAAAAVGATFTLTKQA